MDFATFEFETRTEKAQRAMREQGFDALFFASEAEMRYFTGFRTLFWQSPTRPWYLILPVSGKPIAVIPEIGAPLMAQTWIDDIRTWPAPQPNDDGFSLLVDALSPFNRIGVPMGHETALRMPLTDFDALRETLRHHDFVDATRLVQSLRMVKSEAEIALIADICAIASGSFDRARAIFHTGQSVEDAFRAFRITLLEDGAEDVPYLVGGLGPLGYGDVISPPDATPIREGDVLMLDTGATKNGYFCDFDRNFGFGVIDERTLVAHRKLCKATEAALAIARPGKSCADLFAAMQAVISENTGTSNGNVGRYGHGLGMQLTEQPSIAPWEQTVLREGMVMTLEPSCTVAGDTMLVHEENIVIRDGSPQVLTTRTPPELPIIG